MTEPTTEAGRALYAWLASQGVLAGGRISDIEAEAIGAALNSDKAERVLMASLAETVQLNIKDRARAGIAALREGLAPSDDWCNDDTHTHAPGECPNKIDH